MPETVSSPQDAASPRRRLTAVPSSQVTFDDGLWSARQKTLRDITIPYVYEQMTREGYISALDVQAPAGELRYPFKNRGTTTPVMYWDAHLANWLEAACHTLATHYDPQLDALLDDVIARIASAQEPCGYFNTYFQRHAPDKRWANLRDWHEIFCAGQLFEAAVAHAQATGKDTLLSVARRYADHIDALFGPGEGQRRGYCGHEGVELALVKLYRHTGEQRYLDLATFFVEERGRQPHYYDIEARARGADPADFYHETYELNQSHKPVREQDRVVGHAVRAMFLYAAMADLAAENSDASLLAACERLWTDLTTKRIYVTGGMGPSAFNEGFTTDYDLPNETAYAETCAAIGLVFFAHRMLQIGADSQYGDMMEHVLYNGAISGLSLRGDRFFYENRLTCFHNSPLGRTGTRHRWAWYNVPCCVFNLCRIVSSLGSYVYAVGENEVVVHLYIQGSGRMLVGHTDLTLTQRTDYPWDGAIAIDVDPAEPCEFDLRLRIPAWCGDARLSVNGTPFDLVSNVDRGYARVRRVWRPGDHVTLYLPMPVNRIYAHPDVQADQGRVALKRGPIVYCVESLDNDVPLHRLALPRDSAIHACFEPDLLGGVGTLTCAAVSAESDDGRLYGATPPASREIMIKAIPYHVWDNREPAEMIVWLAESVNG